MQRFWHSQPTAAATAGPSSVATLPYEAWSASVNAVEPVVRIDAAEYRTEASPPYGHPTELVRGVAGQHRMISADLVLQRATARRLADRSGTSRSARRYRLELGPAVPQRAFARRPVWTRRYREIGRG